MKIPQRIVLVLTLLVCGQMVADAVEIAVSGFRTEAIYQQAETSDVDPIAVGDTNLVVQEQTGGRVVYANQFAGTDVGAKINAADAALGSSPGTIYHSGGGNIAVQIVLSDKHVLRLGVGTYTASVAAAPILMKSDTSLLGSGWGTIIQETTASMPRDNNRFIVIASHAAYFLNGSVQQNMVIRDLQIKGARSDFGSITQAVALGNVHGAVVDNVYFNATHSIGLQAGGASRVGNDPLKLGRFASNVTFSNNRFEHVTSQGAAFVNTRHGRIINNTFVTPGIAGSGAGAVSVDLETNQNTDVLEHITVSGNRFYYKGASSEALSAISAACSTVDGAGTGSVLITNNLIDGGDYFAAGGIDNHGSGIYVTRLRDVEISNNFIRVTPGSQPGIRLAATTRANVIGNILYDVNSSSSGAAILVEGSGTVGRHNKIVGNIIKATAAGPSTFIEEQSPADYTYVEGNFADGGVFLVGANSRAVSNYKDNGTITIGNQLISAVTTGTPISKIVIYSPSLTPTSIAANISAEQDFTVAGLTTADKVSVNGPPTEGTRILSVRVKAANTLSITFSNFTTRALTPARGVYNIIAIRN